MIKAVQYGLGVGFIILGVAGLFLPILQGVLMIALGVFILKAPNMTDCWKQIKHKAGSFLGRI